MKLICPQCQSAFRIKPGALGETGRSVRCASCKHVWRATPAELHEESHFLTLGPSGTELDSSPPQNETAHILEKEEIQNVNFEVQHIEAPSIVPDALIEEAKRADPASAPRPLPPSPDNIEQAAVRRARRSPATKTASRNKKRLSAKQGVAAAMTGVLAMSLFIWRHELATLLGGSKDHAASFQGLAFEDVTTSIAHQDDVPVLVITGKIANTTDAPIEIPKLRLAIRDTNGQELFAWSAVPPRSILNPKENSGFRTRLASPPEGSQDILIRFLNQRDLASGMK